LIPARGYLLAVFASAIFGGAVMGCAVSTEDRLVGVWTVDRNGTQMPGSNIPGFEDKVQALTDNLKLKLLPDRTFVLASGPVIEGTWSYRAGIVELTPKAGTRAADATGPIKATATPDLSSLTITRDTPIGNVLLKLRKSG